VSDALQNIFLPLPGNEKQYLGQLTRSLVTFLASCFLFILYRLAELSAAQIV
jgi:hypothetical protein